MKSGNFLAVIVTFAVLAGCSLEPSLAGKPKSVPNIAQAIDPTIPTVTISARRMTLAEKLAYDQSAALKVAHLD